MKRIVLINITILTLMVAYGYAQVGGSMIGKMEQMMQWMMGSEIVVDLSGPRPQENVKTLEAGRLIYERHCAVCHGDKGDGKGKRAVDLHTKPRDFTIGVYKLRSTPSGSLPTDEDIYTTISRGLRGTAMFPWFGLSKKEKWMVTYYIKTFTERFVEEDPDSPITIPKITIPNTELLKRGQRLYEQTKCVDCHGKKGQGDGPKANELKDNWGYSIKMRDFTTETFKRGASVQDIFLTIATGLDGTPMASNSDSISAEDILALATYMKSLNRQHLRRRGGMMGRMSMNPDERAGMKIDHPAFQFGL
jgi:cytochrome c oxidase cbb3-type subunit 2